MPIGLVVTMSLTLLALFGFLFALLAVAAVYFDLSFILVIPMAVGIVVLQWLIGPSIIRWTTNMRYLKHDEYPWIHEIVRDLCKKHHLKMPKLAIVNSGQPNAFVFGRTNGSATICVTHGLMSTLTKDEVKAVIAHEVGHMKQNDMVAMVVVSAIPILTFFVARFLLFSQAGGQRRDVGYLILIGILAWVIYFVTNLLVLMFSRVREYYADRFGGINTKPALLASALAKITYGLGISKEDFKASSARSFFIADPFTSHFEISHFANEFSDLHVSKDDVKKAMEWEKKNLFAKISEIFRSHPLTWKRIRALHQLEEELAKKGG